MSNLLALNNLLPKSEVPLKHLLLECEAQYKPKMSLFVTRGTLVGSSFPRRRFSSQLRLRCPLPCVVIVVVVVVVNGVVVCEVVVGDVVVGKVVVVYGVVGHLNLSVTQAFEESLLIPDYIPRLPHGVILSFS